MDPKEYVKIVEGKEISVEHDTMEIKDEGNHQRTVQKEMTVYVKTLEGKTISVTCSICQTAEEIKTQVEKRTRMQKSSSAS